VTTYPTPPGRIGQAAAVTEVLEHLGSLQAWLGQRREELDALEAQVIATGRQAELTPDLALALALWQAVKTRQEAILRTWDSGRVGQVELEKLSGLFWGRLDTATADLAQVQTMAVSPPEAGRLCDALVAQLRTALNTDPGAEQQQIRLRDLRAQAERLRDQVALEPAALAPAAKATLAGLVARLDDLTARQARGGDIGGRLGPLEIDAAHFERDLIVGAARRREARDLLGSARSLRSALAAREEAVRDLAVRTAAEVWPAPAPTIPALADLGPLPNTSAALAPHLEQLRALDLRFAAVEQELARATAGLRQGRDLLAALQVKAGALGHAGDPVVAGLFGLAGQVLASPPVAAAVVEHLLAACSARLEQLAAGARR
jgi:hypothetical protein